MIWLGSGLRFIGSFGPAAFSTIRQTPSRDRTLLAPAPTTNTRGFLIISKSANLWLALAHRSYREPVDLMQERCEAAAPRRPAPETDSGFAARYSFSIR